MNEGFSSYVAQAADIASSGRWDAVNSRIEIFAANPGPGNVWWVQVFGGLCSQVFSEYNALKRVHEKEGLRRGRLLAWHARNLLELSVWSLYCGSSKDNSRRFFEDAGRDARDIFDAFAKWGAANMQPEDWFQPGERAKQDLLRRAKSEGIESLEGPYKRVEHAADECGLGNSFRISYKLLSKFAHPTAMQVLGQPAENRETIQAEYFFGQGCLFFVGAFTALEARLLESKPDEA